MQQTVVHCFIVLSWNQEFDATIKERRPTVAFDWICGKGALDLTIGKPRGVLLRSIILEMMVGSDVYVLLIRSSQFSSQTQSCTSISTIGGLAQNYFRSMS